MQDEINQDERRVNKMERKWLIKRKPLERKQKERGGTKRRNKHT